MKFKAKRALGLTLYTSFTILIFTGILIFVIGYFLNSFLLIEGSGNVIVSEREVDTGINSIKNNTSFNITLKKSFQEKVTINAENNFIDKIKTSVKGEELLIEVEKLFPYINPITIKNKSPVEIVVEYVELNKITQAGSGYIGLFEDQILKSKDLELKVSGTGEIDIKVESETVSSEITGSGFIKLSGDTKEHLKEISILNQINDKNLLINDKLVQE